MKIVTSTISSGVLAKDNARISGDLGVAVDRAISEAAAPVVVDGVDAISCTLDYPASKRSAPLPEILSVQYLSKQAKVVCRGRMGPRVAPGAPGWNRYRVHYVRERRDFMVALGARIAAMLGSERAAAIASAFKQVATRLDDLVRQLKEETTDPDDSRTVASARPRTKRAGRPTKGKQAAPKGSSPKRTPSTK